MSVGAIDTKLQEEAIISEIQWSNLETQLNTLITLALKNKALQWVVNTVRRKLLFNESNIGNLLSLLDKCNWNLETITEIALVISKKWTSNDLLEWISKTYENSYWRVVLVETLWKKWLIWDIVEWFNMVGWESEEARSLATMVVERLGENIAMYFYLVDDNSGAWLIFAKAVIDNWNIQIILERFENATNNSKVKMEFATAIVKLWKIHDIIDWIYKSDWNSKEELILVNGLISRSESENDLEWERDAESDIIEWLENVDSGSRWELILIKALLAKWYNDAVDYCDFIGNSLNEDMFIVNNIDGDVLIVDFLIENMGIEKVIDMIMDHDPDSSVSAGFAHCLVKKWDIPGINMWLDKLEGDSEAKRILENVIDKSNV